VVYLGILEIFYAPARERGTLIFGPIWDFKDVYFYLKASPHVQKLPQSENVWIKILGRDTALGSSACKP